jgi:Cu-Zn family superoxide dismutase
VTDTAGVLRLAVSVGGLAPGPHGMHIHARGECAAPDFASAGAHFNPENKQHGRLNPAGPHLGDLPNLVVGADGSADTSLALPSGLLGPDVHSLVFHARPDDERTDPSGNSGDRVACAVLQPG